jgi:hypothetical protein
LGHIGAPFSVVYIFAMIKRFDLVTIKTVKNVVWLSGPASRPASPRGVWSVVAGVEGVSKVMLARNETLCIIPVEDVELYVDYDTDGAVQSIKKVRCRSDLKKLNLGGVDNGKEG